MSDRSVERIEYIFKGESLSTLINTELETRDLSWHIWNASSGEFAKASADTTIRLEAGSSDDIMLVVLRWPNPHRYEHSFSQGLKLTPGEHTLEIRREPAQSFFFSVDHQPVAELVFRDSQLDACHTEVRAVWMYRLSAENIRLPEAADLELLQISECGALTNLVGLAQLAKLRTLGLFSCGSLTDLDPLRSLAGLRSLWVVDCQKVRELAPLSALKLLGDLNLSNPIDNQGALEDVAALADLCCLKTLSLGGQRGVTELPSLSRLTRLKHLNLSSCGALQRLPDFPCASSLQTLTASFCEALEDISALANATSLEKLNLLGCEKISDLMPLRGLTQLKDLDLSGGWSNQGALKDIAALTDLKCLESLSLKSQAGITELPSFSGLTRLKHLDLSSCKAIRRLPDFPCASSLKTVDASSCDALEDVSALANATSLEKLNLYGCKNVSDLTPLRGLTELQSLNHTGLGVLVDISPLDTLTSLRDLELSIRSTDLTPLRGMTRLESLGLDSDDQLVDISPLDALTSLRRLRLSLRTTDLTPLRGMIRLESLDLHLRHTVADISPLRSLTSLRRLILVDYKEVADLAPLSGLAGLDELHLSGFGNLVDITALGGLTSLRMLNFSDCQHLSDVTAMANLLKLEQLSMSNCVGVEDISPLSHLASLQRLFLNGCNEVTDLTPLSGLPRIEQISLSGCTHIHSLRPLRGCSSLRVLTTPSRPEEVAMVLADCAVARKDVETIKSSASGWLQEVPVARDIDELAVCLAEAFGMGSEKDWGRDALAKLVAAMRKRGDGTTDTWRCVLLQCLRCGDPVSCDILASLLDGADAGWVSTRFAEPTLQALADVPASSEKWGEEYVARLLKMLPESRLREIGTSICLFYAKLKRRDLVRSWLGRIANQAAPLWGDRVRGALAMAALEAGDLAEGREYLQAMETDSQRDMVREKLVLALAERCPLEAGQVFDEVVDELRRRDLAKGLAEQDSFVAHRQNLYRLLIELEDDDQALANLLAQVAVRHPETRTLAELRRMLLPPRVPGLQETVVRLLSSPAVKENVKARRLVEFQDRLAQDPMAIERGVADWLLDRMEAEHLITSEERSEIRKALFTEHEKAGSQFGAEDSP